MNNKIIIIVFIFLLLSGAIFLSKKDKYQKEIISQLKKLLKKQKKQLEMPVVLLCLLILKKLLTHFDKNIKIKLVKKNKKLIADTAIKFIKKPAKSRMNSDLYEYETIGYEEGPCYQGMYKTK